MTVDARCLIATDLGRLLDGSGLSEDHAQETGLVTYRGSFTFDGLHTPTRGQVIQLAYARPQYGASGLLTRFYPRLHCISSSADPFANDAGITTVEVGCALTLKSDRKDAITYKAIDHPPAWWSALSADRQAVVPPTIAAQGVIQFCLDRLDIDLAGGSATSPDVLLREEIDLSGGYVEVLNDLLRSAMLVGHMTPAGELLVQSVEMGPAAGPVLTSNELLSLQPINDRGGAEQVTVEFDAVEIPSNADAGSIDINSDEQKLRDWELERTIGPPTTYTVEYLSQSWSVGTGQSVELPEPTRYKTDVEVTQTSENRTTYRSMEYTDLDGKEQSQDIVIRRVSTIRSSVSGVQYFRARIASIDIGSSVVSAFLFPPSGAIPYDTDTVTEYTYEITEEGPRLKREETNETEAEAGFATRLPVENWIIDNSIPLLTGSTKVSRVVIENEVDEQSGLTKRKTTRWTASGKTQGGNQAARSSFRDVATNGPFAEALAATKPLKMEGTEVSISIGRQSGLQSRPSSQTRLRDALTGAFLDDNSLTNSGTVASSYGQREPQTVTASYSFGGAGVELLNTATYRLPFAPDDAITATNGVSTGIVDLALVRGNARGRALEYGRIQNAIAFGHANGVEVTTAPWELPSAPFAPVYLDVSGLSTAFRVHGRNWEISGGAMIVTADLMLVGTAGRLTGGTPVPWVPLTSAAGDLNALGAASGSGEILPANTITLPGGFDPDAPGSVWASLPTNGTDAYGPSRTPAAIAPPFVQTVTILARSRSVVIVTELLYSVAPITEDVLAVSRSRAFVAEVVIVNVPLTTLTLTPQIPAVYVPVVVAVPLTALTLTPQVPIVYTPVVVNVPLTTLTLAAFAPTLNVASVPLTTLTLAALVPSVSPVTDPEFANVSLLLPFDGTDGSTTFTDESNSPFTVTAFGNAQLDTAFSQFGGASLLLDGTGDYATIASPPVSLREWHTANYQIDAWVRVAAFTQRTAASSSVMVGNMTPTSGSQWWSFGPRTGGTVRFTYWNGAAIESAETAATISLNTQTHLRMTHSGGTIRIFIAGNLEASASVVGTPQYSASDPFTIGACENFWFNGHVDDLRIQRGGTVSTASFTPPATAWPTS